MRAIPLSRPALKPSSLKRGRQRYGDAMRAQLVMFLAWPFLGMISSLIQFRKPWSKTIFWLFCVYFGYVFVYADPFGGDNADSARYALEFLRLHKSPISLQALIGTFYSPDSSELDLYRGTLMWLVSRVSGDPRVMFAVFAAVFGFFLAQNLWLIFGTIEKKVGLVLASFIAVFILTNPLWNINGVRMWTAAQIFLYGILVFFLKKERRGLMWAAASILVHFSFMFPVAVLLAWFFIPRHPWLLVVFYFGTAFVNEINLHLVRDALSFMPKIFEQRIDGYTSEVYAAEVFLARETMKWHVKWASTAARAVCYTWAVALFLNRKRWATILPKIWSMFLFTLLIGGAANIAALVPSGIRFQVISQGLFFAIIVGVLGAQNVWLGQRRIEVLTFPINAYLIVFKIRLGFDFIGFLTFAGNPLIAILIDRQTPLIKIVKSLFFVM